MKNHRYIPFSRFIQKLNQSRVNLYVMFIYKTAKFAPVRANILEILEIFVHRTIAHYALFRTGV